MFSKLALDYRSLEIHHGCSLCLTRHKIALSLILCINIWIDNSVQSLSHAQLFQTPWTAELQASLFMSNSQNYSKSCPLSQWFHPTISSSVILFSSHLQFFPTSGSFQTSRFFGSAGQSIGVSASASVLPMNIQDWFPLGWTG